jgi:hypothetical protein
MPTRENILLSPAYLMININSWEPAVNLEQCERLVESFWDDIGHDNADHPEGTECIPSERWIGEHTFFRAELLSFMELHSRNGEKEILA